MSTHPGKGYEVYSIFMQSSRERASVDATNVSGSERSIRNATPHHRKSWLFCWSEVGAEAVATLQSLIVTCRVHDIDPYDYLVDVLQRINRHSDAEVQLLIPRLWGTLKNPIPGIFQGAKRKVRFPLRFIFKWLDT